VAGDAIDGADIIEQAVRDWVDSLTEESAADRLRAVS